MPEDVCVFSKDGRCTELKESFNGKINKKDSYKKCDGDDQDCDIAEFED